MATQLQNGKAANRAKPAPVRKSRRVWSSNPAVALWDTMVGKKVVMAVTGFVLARISHYPRAVDHLGMVRRPC